MQFWWARSPGPWSARGFISVPSGASSRTGRRTGPAHGRPGHRAYTGDSRGPSRSRPARKCTAVCQSSCGAGLGGRLRQVPCFAWDSARPSTRCCRWLFGAGFAAPSPRSAPSACGESPLTPPCASSPRRNRTETPAYRVPAEHTNGHGQAGGRPSGTLSGSSSRTSSRRLLLPGLGRGVDDSTTIGTSGRSPRHESVMTSRPLRAPLGLGSGGGAAVRTRRRTRVILTVRALRGGRWSGGVVLERLAAEINDFSEAAGVLSLHLLGLLAYSFRKSRSLRVAHRRHPPAHSTRMLRNMNVGTRSLLVLARLPVRVRPGMPRSKDHDQREALRARHYGSKRRRMLLERGDDRLTPDAGRRMDGGFGAKYLPEPLDLGLRSIGAGEDVPGKFHRIEESIGLSKRLASLVGDLIPFAGPLPFSRKLVSENRHLLRVELNGPLGRFADGRFPRRCHSSKLGGKMAFARLADVPVTVLIGFGRARQRACYQGKLGLQRALLSPRAGNGANHRTGLSVVVGPRMVSRPLLNDPLIRKRRHVPCPAARAVLRARLLLHPFPVFVRIVRHQHHQNPPSSSNRRIVSTALPALRPFSAARSRLLVPGSISTVVLGGLGPRLPDS